ncbi:unnamed protein product [Blepharisma stoltei]|uniref:PAS domain-containing protein n=1 Tax=Blepharisma stoltei TaxID=1481888 RepID=A0AAU9K9Y1_9CILI|nr:unnamed protein product [Blepharisma stoltei]
MGLSDKELIGRIIFANFLKPEGEVQEISDFSIYKILGWLYPSNQVSILMERFFGKSPFESGSEDSQLLYVKRIENLLGQSDGRMNSIVSVYKNHFEGSWDLLVILPSQDRVPPKIYYRNSKHEHLKLPPLIEFLFKNKLKANEIEENKENIIGGMLKPFQIVAQEDLSNMDSVHQNKGGWWALFRAILIILFKNEDFLRLMPSWNYTFYEMQKYFKEKRIELSRIDLPPDRSNRQAWMEDQKLLVLQTLNEDISKWEANTNKVCDVTNTIAYQLEFWTKIMNTSSDSLDITPRKPFSCQIIDTSKQDSNIKIKKNWEFACSTFSFEDIIRDEIVYVDKTLFIKKVLDDTDYAILITRPRGWGKSLNIDMLKTFLSDEKDERINSMKKALFTEERKSIINGLSNSSDSQKLAIATVDNGKYIENHARKYPVIFLSFLECEIYENIEEEIHECFGSAISYAFKEHEYVVNELKRRLAENYDKQLAKEIEMFYKFYNNDPNSELLVSIQFLSKVLYKFHQKKVFILIDEYDRPLNCSFSKDSYDTIVQIMDNMLTYWIQYNADYVEKAIITGVLTWDLPSLNNLMVNSVVDRYFSEYYGFTESEVDKILREASVWNTEEDLELNKRQIASWYDGYSSGGLKIYNPWSIMNCFFAAQSGEENIFRDYWIDRGNDYELKRLLKNFTCKVELSELLRTGYLTLESELPTRVNIARVSNNKKQFFALLLHSGYLTPLHKSKKENTERRIVYSESINKQRIYVMPNREVKKFVFHILIESWLGNLENKIPDFELSELISGLNENLEKSERYASIIKNEILNYFDNDDHYEIDFQILIEWHSLITGIPHAEEPRHTLLSKVINKENSEAIYLPIRNRSACIVVHEHKKLISTTTYEVEKTTFNALIQIYEKGYMDDALNMYETNSYCSYYTHIVVRVMVFYKMEGYPNWNLKIMFRVHRIHDAIEIRNALKLNKIQLKNCKNEADLDELLESIVGPINEEEKQIEQEMGLVEINLKRKSLIDTDVKTKRPKPESIKGIEEE